MVVLCCDLLMKLFAILSLLQLAGSTTETNRLLPSADQLVNLRETALREPQLAADTQLTAWSLSSLPANSIRRRLRNRKNNSSSFIVNHLNHIR